jgi:hypothetical protein
VLGEGPLSSASAAARGVGYIGACSPARAAARMGLAGCQFQGNSSATRLAGWSAIRARTSARALLAGVPALHDAVEALRQCAGSNTIFNRIPVAAAKCSSMRVDGFTRPLSRRAITACVVCLRSANCSCGRPAWARASMIGSSGRREFVLERAVGVRVLRVGARRRRRLRRKSFCCSCHLLCTPACQLDRTARR